jgi:DNA-binding protein H-NS
MNEDQKKDYGVLIAKKSEKLVTALYLVTDLMNDNEPIKHGLRKNGVALLTSMNALAQLDVKDRILELKTSLKAVTEVTSMLHVSVTTGIASKMNGELLMEGFRSLQLVLEKKQPIFTKEMLHVENEEELENDSNFSSAVTSTSYDALTPLTLARLHENKYELRRTQESLRQDQILAKVGNKGQIKEGTIKDKIEETDVDIKDKDFKNDSTHSVLMEHAMRPVNNLASSFQMKKLSRREQILALFVRGVDVSIKDIAVRIKGCSEKTIQRELNTLLYDNIIERIGEKRWSRYILR